MPQNAPYLLEAVQRVALEHSTPAAEIVLLVVLDLEKDEVEVAAAVCDLHGHRLEGLYRGVVDCPLALQLPTNSAQSLLVSSDSSGEGIIFCECRP